jgi:hypothetical protein
MKVTKYIAASLFALFLFAQTAGIARPLPEGTSANVLAPAALHLSPDQALVRFHERNSEQANRLLAYQDQMLVTADLPDAAKHGEFALLRTYTQQPRNLTFDTISYTGDGFVKNNVIVRYLQSEVAHATKDDPSATALTENNYKFAFKGSQTINGHDAYVFQLKPHHRRPGLFKGRFYLDSASGSLLRMEGRLAKSPSLFIRSIDFTQDFEDIDGFTLPTHLQSVTRTHLIGRAIVNVFHKAYRIGTGAQSQLSAVLPPPSSN